MDSVSYRQSNFDIVYSAYVLEHIDGAVTALENFVEWARPGGLIVMWLPNRNSVYAWMARHTPHRFHIWVYRYVFGNRNEENRVLVHTPRITIRCSRELPCGLLSRT